MPVSPLTPLSLSAAVNLEHLRIALRELEREHGFYVDPGIWCCRTCAVADAWEEGANKSYVFWHEQNEDSLHRNPTKPMPLYYGIAREDASTEEISIAAKTIRKVLEKHDLHTEWEDEDIEKCIWVHLDVYKPNTDSKDEDENDYLDVDLYLPMNEETEEFCWNDCEDCGGPEDAYFFSTRIDDGESLKDAILKVEPQIIKHITHYKRCLSSEGCSHPQEDIISIHDTYGHAGRISLKDLLDETEVNRSEEKEAR